MASRMEAIAGGLEAIAGGLEAIASRLEAIASRLRCPPERRRRLRHRRTNKRRQPDWGGRRLREATKQDSILVASLLLVYSMPLNETTCGTSGPRKLAFMNVACCVRNMNDTRQGLFGAVHRCQLHFVRPCCEDPFFLPPRIWLESVLLVTTSKALVSTSKALVTTSDALVPSSVALVTTSKALVYIYIYYIHMYTRYTGTPVLTIGTPVPFRGRQ